MRNLVIFDLDETLVHATERELARPADFRCASYHVYKRPFLDDLLSVMTPLCDIAVWSSSSRQYVDAVASNIHAEGFKLKFAWAVDRCIQKIDLHSNGYVYIKDLRKVQGQGYTLERITIVDDSPEKVVRQPRNHVQVKPFTGDPNDRELLDLSQQLSKRLG